MEIIKVMKVYRSKILDDFFKDITPEQEKEQLIKIINEVCQKNELLKEAIDKAYDMSCDIYHKSILPLNKHLRKAKQI